MEIVGQRVLHPIYGEGSITWYGGDAANDHKYIVVSFTEKEMKLPFPSTFKKHLEALDEAFAQSVREELKKQSSVATSKEQACLPSSSKTHVQTHKPLTYCSKNTFTFTDDKISNIERSRYGFATYDNENRLVAVAAMHVDKRDVSYGQAELCFFDRYRSEFGEWRLIAINKQRMSFERLTDILMEKGSFTATIDPRRGS